MATDVLNRAAYSGADFDTYSDDLRARLQVKFAADYNDFALSSLGIMLMDIVAYGLSTLSFYLDRRATDTYLSTARTRRSVSRTARQLGYKMGGAVASGVDLHVRVLSPKAFAVPIAKGTQFAGPNGTIFEAAEDVVFTPIEQANNTTKVVPAYEGETLDEQFVSDGTANQVFDLAKVPENKFIVQGSVTVKVDAADFEEVDLIQVGKTDQFEIGYNDDPSTVRFGDGNAGNIPITGGTIDVTYAASFGKSGIVPKETITSLVSPLVVSFETIELSINNPLPSSGGDDPETIAQVKARAPFVFKSGMRAVVEEDYLALAGSFADPLFGRVAAAKAISSRSAASDLTLQNLLIDIDNAIQSFKPAISASVDTAVVQLDEVDTQLTSISTEQTGLSGSATAVQTQATTIIAAARTIKSSVSEIQVDAADIQLVKLTADTAVDASAATATEKDTIKGYLSRMSAEAASINTQAASVTVNADAIVTAARAQEDELNDTWNPGLTALAAAQVSASAASVAVRTAVLAIDATNEAIETSIVTDKSAAIYAHMDKVLSADCKANLVTVPILTRDSGGFYTAPSQGLINSLQLYLDERKEVTHSVEVTSGAQFLVGAVIAVRLGVKRGFSQEVVRTAVETAIDGLLRDRSFGSSLYELDVERVIEVVDGVRFANVDITGPTDHLDSDGNLIAAASEMITKDSVTVTPELVTEQ